MATVDEDLVSGHRAIYYARGADIERTFRVSGLVGSPWAQLDEALNTPGVPQLYDPYPSPPANNLIVQNREAFPDGPNAARIVIFYTNNPGPTWSQPQPIGNGQDVKQFDGTAVKVKLTNDRAAAPMLINPPVAFQGWDPYLSEVELDVPAGLLVFEQPRDVHPAAIWRTHGRTVNVASIGAYNANELLFWRVSGQSNDGGRVWNCTYQFQYDPLGHKHTDRFHGPDGKVPQGAVDVSFNVRPTSDFSLIPVDFSDSQTPV